MRPRTPLLTRLSALLKVSSDDLQAQLYRWPATDPTEIATNPCWPGPRQIRHVGNPTPPVRALLEHRLGRPLHASWRLQRLCPTQNCCQPLHWELTAIRGPSMEPLPIELFVQADITVDDIVDMILMIDGRKHDPESLAARFDVPIEIVHAALAEIAKDGL